MSLINEIRELMAKQSGPVHPKYVAEVLDQDLSTVRNTMNQANTKGNGIERLDDGTFMLIPGWKPSRGPNAVAEPAAIAGAPPAPAASPGVSAVARKAPKKIAKKRAAKAAPGKAKRKYVRKAAPTPKGRTARQAPLVANNLDNVMFSRTSLALLVQGVLAGNAEIDLSLRHALREAASHALPF